MKLYIPNNWCDVNLLCDDDVKYHDKERLLVDYGSFESLKQSFTDQKIIIENLKTDFLKAQLHIEDARYYFNELKHCASTSNQRSIIEEALRILPEFKSV